MEKPYKNKGYGCSDTLPPSKTSIYTLSRLTDAMYYAQLAGLNPKDVFALASEEVKMEWNFANWSYQEE